MTPDLINGLFELGGTFVVCLSIRRALKDGAIKGLSFWHVAFFTGWGLWNCFYYPHLDQTFSFLAGVALTVVNAVYFVLWLRFNGPRIRFREPRQRRPAPPIPTHLNCRCKVVPLFPEPDVHDGFCFTCGAPLKNFADQFCSYECAANPVFPGRD